MNQSKEIARSGDYQQYPSEPMPPAARKGPVVTLINAMPDPLGSLAAICGIYQGRVTRSLSEISDDQRKYAFQNMLKTVLDGALEVGYFHFLIEGVSRDFTHQAVRNRFSFIAQESLRFAVKEHWAEEIPIPVEIQTDSHQLVWEEVLETAAEGYEELIRNGAPAEVARKLLPMAVTTRYHWVVDLRNLLQEAAKRTCTQAQFEWRIVFSQIAKALREYGHEPGGPNGESMPTSADAWQFAFIADQLRPNCYQTGSCGFMAQFDRGCTIRDRVEIRARHGGNDPSYWDRPFIYDEVSYDLITGAPVVRPRTSEGINPREWAANPGAARLTTPTATEKWAPAEIVEGIEPRYCPKANNEEAHQAHGWEMTVMGMTHGYYCHGLPPTPPCRPIKDNPQA